MRNFSSIIAATVFLFAVLGCGITERIEKATGSSDNGGSNRTLTDDAVDTAIGESKIGVPECDEVMGDLTAEMNDPDDNFVTKAIKATVLNRIKDGIRESVEENKSDTVELAKTCKEFKIQLEKFKAEQEAKEKSE